MRRLVVTEHKSHACGATRGTKWHTIKDTKSGQSIVIESPEDIAHAVRQIAADYGMAVAELVGDERKSGAGGMWYEGVWHDTPPLAKFGQGDYETEINE